MNDKILLVDDEPDILEFLDYNLTKEGFSVIKAHDGEEALGKIIEKPDLIVLDLLLPKMDGFEVCKRIRATKGYENIPIILLTSKSGESNEILGLELGANDYIQKPISTKKFIARIKSNLRNTFLREEAGSLPKKISVGPIIINREKYLVYIDGVEKVFPRKEFELLYYLASNPGHVFKRESLLQNIWGNNVYVVDRTVDVHITKIRQKLGNYSNLIETIKGVGYRFREN